MILIIMHSRIIKDRDFNVLHNNKISRFQCMCGIIKSRDYNALQNYKRSRLLCTTEY